jgi:hypothetical protein
LAVGRFDFANVGAETNAPKHGGDHGRAGGTGTKRLDIGSRPCPLSQNENGTKLPGNPLT